MDKGILLGLIWTFLAVCCLGLLMAYINRKYGKHPCEDCGQKISYDEDHWCEKKIQRIREQQFGRIFDSKGHRKIHISWWCPHCKDTRHRVTIYDIESSLPDRSVVIESFCGSCARLLRV